MSPYNPYAKYMDGRTPEVILAESGATLALLLTRIGPVRVHQTTAPGKWSPAEIIAHLADCEIAFAFRLRQALAEEGHVIQPFDQDKWAMHYSESNAEEALALFIALRNWNLKLIQNVMPASASRRVTHPERGSMSFYEMLESFAGHDLNHIAQLKTMTASA